MKFFKLFLLLASSIANGADYYGAEVYSKDKVRYGKFEFSMKTSFASGTLSTFFLYDDLSWQGDHLPWAEIDLEILQKEKDFLQTNLITGTVSNRNMSEEFHRFHSKLNEDFHVYTIEWLPHEIAWYIDGQLIRKAVGEQVNQIGNSPLSYRFNHWASHYVEWVGEIDDSKLPVVQKIDWIQYSEFVPGNSKEERFQFLWEDDFKFFDSNRWSKAYWDFTGSVSQFVPENAFVANGVLHLELSKNRK